MKYLSLLGVLSVLMGVSYAQQHTAASAWDYIRDEREGLSDSQDVSSQFDSYDFGQLCLHNQLGRLGFIGRDYQRFYLYFSSISKDQSNPRVYHVRGKSRVTSTVCDFTGTMRLSWVRRAHAPDACENDIRPAIQGISFFTYEYNGNLHQKHAGRFRGTAVVQWYLDKQKRVCYDNTWACSDLFANNCFVGTWTSYNTRVSKQCNWGNARIPFSGELDCGAGEFAPADRFSKFGWDTYSRPDTVAWWK
jgi:hypothetical protein